MDFSHHGYTLSPGFSVSLIADGCLVLQKIRSHKYGERRFETPNLFASIAVFDHFSIMAYDIAANMKNSIEYCHHAWQKGDHSLTEPGLIPLPRHFCNATG